MKVWLINQFAVPPSQSGGTRHFALAREIKTYGIEVNIICSSTNYLTRIGLQSNSSDYCIEEIDGVSFCWLKSRKYGSGILARLMDMFHFSYLVLTGRWFQRLPKPAIIIGSSPSLFAAYAAYLLARRFDIPFVLEVRDIWPQTLIDLGGYSQYNPGIMVLGLIEKYLYRKSDHVVTLLPHAHEHIVRQGGRAENVTWIPNGVDLDIVHVDDNENVSDGRKNNEVFLVKYAGAFGLANALDAILDTAKLLQSQHKNRFRFEMIGYGHERKRLYRRVYSEHINNVIFRDPVPKRDIYRVLAESDALIVNMNDGGIYRFGISFNKIFDYLAVARPIIFGSATVENPVRDSDAGFCVPANDAEEMARALEQLALLSPFQRHVMGARGRAYAAENHDVKKLASRLESVLKGVAAKRTDMATVL